MKPRAPLLKSLLLLGAALALWYWGRGRGSQEAEKADPAGRPATAASQSVPANLSEAPKPSVVLPPIEPEVPEADPLELSDVPAAAAVDPALALQTGPLPWESRVDQILKLNTVADSVKARQLFGLLSLLPEEGLETVANQALKRLPDRDYGAVSQTLLNPQTHGRVLGVMFEDLLERRDQVTLPMLLAVAKNPAHPFAESARDNLRLWLGADYGANWGQWDGAVQRALAEGGRRK